MLVAAGGKDLVEELDSAALARAVDDVEALVRR
jgi:hypothetical protein